jgi:hypothetical protein
LNKWWALGYKNEKKVSNLKDGPPMKPRSQNEKQDGLQALMCTIENLT